MSWLGLRGVAQLGRAGLHGGQQGPVRQMTVAGRTLEVSVTEHLPDGVRGLAA